MRPSGSPIRRTVGMPCGTVRLLSPQRKGGLDALGVVVCDVQRAAGVADFPEGLGAPTRLDPGSNLAAGPAWLGLRCRQTEKLLPRRAVPLLVYAWTDPPKLARDHVSRCSGCSARDPRSTCHRPAIGAHRCVPFRCSDRAIGAAVADSRYCLLIAICRRCSGVMRSPWSSSAMSIRTQLTVPVNTLCWGV